MLKKVLAGAVVAGGMLVASTGTAFSEHDHFVLREDRDGTTQCRYIAEGQTAKGADEPGGHAFHDNVHTGQPGSDDQGTDFDKSDNADRCDEWNTNGQ